MLVISVYEIRNHKRACVSKIKVRVSAFPFQARFGYILVWHSQSARPFSRTVLISIRYYKRPSLSTVIDYISLRD